MRIGNTIIPTTGILATIDTGTSAMLMPKSYADQINSAIPGALQAVGKIDFIMLTTTYTLAPY